MSRKAAPPKCVSVAGLPGPPLWWDKQMRLVVTLPTRGQHQTSKKCAPSLSNTDMLYFPAAGDTLGRKIALLNLHLPSSPLISITVVPCLEIPRLEILPS